MGVGAFAHQDKVGVVGSRLLLVSKPEIAGQSKYTVPVALLTTHDCCVFVVVEWKRRAARQHSGCGNVSPCLRVIVDELRCVWRKK